MSNFPTFGVISSHFAMAPLRSRALAGRGRKSASRLSRTKTPASPSATPAPLGILTATPRKAGGLVVTQDEQDAARKLVEGVFLVPTRPSSGTYVHCGVKRKGKEKEGEVHSPSSSTRSGPHAPSPTPPPTRSRGRDTPGAEAFQPHTGGPSAEPPASSSSSSPQVQALELAGSLQDAYVPPVEHSAPPSESFETQNQNRQTTDHNTSLPSSASHGNTLLMSSVAQGKLPVPRHRQRSQSVSSSRPPKSCSSPTDHARSRSEYIGSIPEGPPQLDVGHLQREHRRSRLSPGADQIDHRASQGRISLTQHDLDNICRVNRAIVHTALGDFGARFGLQLIGSIGSQLAQDGSEREAAADARHVQTNKSLASLGAASQVDKIRLLETTKHLVDEVQQGIAHVRRTQDVELVKARREKRHYESMHAASREQCLELVEEIDRARKRARASERRQTQEGQDQQAQAVQDQQAQAVQDRQAQAGEYQQRLQAQQTQVRELEHELQSTARERDDAEQEREQALRLAKHHQTSAKSARHRVQETAQGSELLRKTETAGIFRRIAAMFSQQDQHHAQARIAEQERDQISSLAKQNQAQAEQERDQASSLVNQNRILAESASRRVQEKADGQLALRNANIAGLTNRVGLLTAGAQVSVHTSEPALTDSPHVRPIDTMQPFSTDIQALNRRVTAAETRAKSAEDDTAAVIKLMKPVVAAKKLATDIADHNTTARVWVRNNDNSQLQRRIALLTRAHAEETGQARDAQRNAEIEADRKLEISGQREDAAAKQRSGLEGLAESVGEAARQTPADQAAKGRLEQTFRQLENLKAGMPWDLVWNDGEEQS